MAKIKCEYRAVKCGCLESEYFRDDLEEACDDDARCFCNKYMPSLPQSILANGVIIGSVANPICAHCEFKTIRFEKSVKNYELEIWPNGNGHLTMGKLDRDLWDLDYLSIDDRVYVGG